MKNFLKYITTLCFLAGCSSKPNDFELYLSEIKNTPMPIKFSTISYADKRIKNDPDKFLFEKFKYIHANGVYGKVLENEKTVGIIYSVDGDVLTPVLMTYDKQGKKVDSLDLFDNASGFNLEKETFVTVIIESNRTISEIDSTISWTLNQKKDDRIPNSDKLSIDFIRYLISDNGKITRLRQMKKNV